MSDEIKTNVVETTVDKPNPEVVLPDDAYSSIIDDGIKNGEKQMKELQDAHTKGSAQAAEIQKALERIQLNLHVVNGQVENLKRIKQLVGEKTKV